VIIPETVCRPKHVRLPQAFALTCREAWVFNEMKFRRKR
jgi:hypothetical protein